MKISSRPESPRFDSMVDTQPTDMMLDIDPLTNKYTLTVKLTIDVPHEISYDYTKFAAFVEDVKTKIKVVR